MIEKIINSKIRLSILTLLFNNEKKSFYAQEVINRTGMDPANIHKELGNLVEGNFLKVTKKENHKYYSINQKNIFYNGLKELFESYNNLQSNEWFLLEEISYKTNPNALATYMDTDRINQYLKSQKLKSRIGVTVSEYDHQTARIWFKIGEFEVLQKEIFDKIIADPKWVLNYIKETERCCEEYFNISRQVYQTNLDSLDDKDLQILYAEQLKVEFQMRLPGWIQNTLEMRGQFFSNYLLGYLKTITKNRKTKDLNAGDIFSILTSPARGSYVIRERIDLLQLADEISRSREARVLFTKNGPNVIEDEIIKYPTIDKLLIEHTKKYGWLSYQNVGPAWKKDFFIGVISSWLKREKNIHKKVDEEKTKLQRIKENQKKVEEQLKIDKRHKILFEIARGIAYTKELRKDSRYFGYFCQDLLNREIAKRKFITIDEVRNIYYWELGDFLAGKVNIGNQLKSRIDYHVAEIKEGARKILLGKEAKSFMFSLNKEDLSRVIKTDEIEGVCASSGIVRGKVRIVNTIMELLDFKEGEILVSSAGTPNLMPAIIKSAGIITDLGGITCHAAILARELEKPCVVGTRFATKILKNGDTVEINAGYGKVMIMKHHGG